MSAILFISRGKSFDNQCLAYIYELSMKASSLKRFFLSHRKSFGPTFPLTLRPFFLPLFASLFELQSIVRPTNRHRRPASGVGDHIDY